MCERISVLNESFKWTKSSLFTYMYWLISQIQILFVANTIVRSAICSEMLFTAILDMKIELEWNDLQME